MTRKIIKTALTKEIERVNVLREERETYAMTKRFFKDTRANILDIVRILRFLRNFSIPTGKQQTIKAQIF